MARHFIHATPKVARDAMAIVAALHDVPVVTLHMQDSRRSGARLRSMVVGLLDGFAPALSTITIGRILGRDHSTVSALLGRYRELLSRVDYLDKVDLAREAMIALGHEWHGPTARGMDMDRRRTGVCRRWNERYASPARQRAAA